MGESADKHRNMTVMASEKSENEKKASLLIEAGTDNEGNTPLHRAIKLNNTEVVKVLIEKTADKDEKNKNGETVLHLAALKNNAEIALILIEKGTDKEAIDNKGNTALHMAASKNNAEVAQILIEKQAD